MRHAWMNAVAVAALTAGIAAANAQSAGEQKQDREPQAQSQGQSPGGGAEQPSARPEKQERSGAQERGGQAQRDSDAKSGTGEAPKAGAAQKDEKDDASRTTQSEPKGSKQDRQTQTQDRDSDKRGERAGSTEKKDSGTAQTRDRDNQRAGQRDRDDDRANRQDRDRDERRAGDRDRDRDRAGDRDRDRDRTAGDRQDRQGGDRVQFSERERSSIRETISRENVERTNVNINVSIGATVPRNITLRPLPASIIEINPAYRSYRYVVVRDEIVIINPQTYHVVEVVPLSGGSAVRAGRGSNRASVQLSSEQRRRILTYAQAECDTVLATPEFQISVGTRIPERIELCPFEDVLVREVDVVRPYRFFVVKDEVVLVDPSDHTIVEVIR